MKFTESKKLKAALLLMSTAILSAGCQNTFQQQPNVSANDKEVQRVSAEGPIVVASLKWTDLTSKESLKNKFSGCESVPRASNFLIQTKWKKECSFKTGTTNPSVSILTLDNSDNLKEGTQPIHIQLSFPSGAEYGKFVDAIWEKHRGKYKKGKKDSPVPGLWDSESYGGKARNDYWRFYETCTETTCFVYQITTDDGDINMSAQNNMIWAYPTRATYSYLYRNSDY